MLAEAYNAEIVVFPECVEITGFVPVMGGKLVFDVLRAYFALKGFR